MTARITSSGAKAGLLLCIVGVPVLLVMVFVPWIGAVAVALLLPVILLAMFSGAMSSKHDRLRTGHCRSCEYPLLGLEHADRCPECGEAIQPHRSRERPTSDRVTVGVATIGFSLALAACSFFALMVTGNLGVWVFVVGPIALVLVVVAIISAVVGPGVSAAGEAEDERCLHCGYPVADITIDRCPECGEAIDDRLSQGAADQ